MFVRFDLSVIFLNLPIAAVWIFFLLECIGSQKWYLLLL